MSVKEDWRRKQTVSDETLEENWKLMFGNKERAKTNEREVHERISKNEEAVKGAQIVTRECLGGKVDSNIPIKSYSGEAVLTIPEEDRVCTWEEVVDPSSKLGLVWVTYRSDCGDDIIHGLYNGKVEAILKRATHCIHCGKKVKWKN